MRKKNTTGRFIVLAVISLILLVLTIFSFPIPTTDYDFVGFLSAIETGIDYKGGTVINYDVNNDKGVENLGAGISANAKRIEYVLADNSYDANCYQNGNYLVVELIKEFDISEISQIINAKTEFTVTSSQEEDAEALLTVEDISNAYGTTSGSNAGLYMEFTTEGQSKFASATSAASSSSPVTLYFNIGTKQLPVSVSNAYNNGYIFITINTENALDDANIYGATIMSAKYDLSFEQASTSVISLANATKNKIVSLVLLLVVFACIVTILCCFFKYLGLVGSFILFISVLLQIILLQAFPSVVLTAPAFAGALLAMVVGGISIFAIFDKMSREYKLGKKLNASITFGYKKIWAVILDLFVVLAIPTLITYFFGSYAVKSFALVFVLSLFVYAVCVLLLTRLFSKWLLNISPAKGADYGFKREAHVDELA